MKAKTCAASATNALYKQSFENKGPCSPLTEGLVPCQVQHTTSQEAAVSNRSPVMLPS